MTRAAPDSTFDDMSLYGSAHWAAARLGRKADWLRSNRDLLVSDGFPTPDPIVGLYLKADVDAWIARRAKKAHHASTAIEQGEVNHNAL